MRIKAIFVYAVDYEGIPAEHGRMRDYPFNYPVGINKLIQCIECIRLGLSVHDQGCDDPVRFGVILDDDTEVTTPIGGDDISLIGELLKQGKVTP